MRAAGACVFAVLLVATTLNGLGVARADPFVEQSELLGHGASFGGEDHAAALSADGSTALVGAPNGQSGRPSYALVFTRAGAGWSAPTTLVPEVEPGVDRVPENGFGASVALSATGSTALVGDMYGSAYVFTKEGAAWRSTRLEEPSELACPERFGEAVALSEDGDTAIIGDPYGCPEDYDGSAYVYVRSGSTWMLQAGPLHGEEKINPFGNADGFASTVAISGDGDTAIIGARGEHGDMGAALIFQRSGSTWSQDGPRLNPPSGEADVEFGRSVAISGDGSHVLIGTGEERNEGSGAWLFDLTAGGWTPQARLASGARSNVYGAFGWSVALSRSGETALVGGPETAPESQGEAWAFRCSSGTWLREPIQPPVSAEEGDFGDSVALAGNASTALVSARGVPGEGSQEGGAFVLTSSPEVPGSCAGTSSGVPGTGTSAGPGAGVSSSPAIGFLRQTHAVWREGRATAELSSRRSRTAVGTSFELSLSEPALLRFRFVEMQTGHISHGRCVDRGPWLHRARSCQLGVGRGALTLSALPGRRRLRFEGRIARRDALPPGAYRLEVTAERAKLRSAPRDLRFTILP